MFSADSTTKEVAAALADQIKGKTVLITGVTRNGLGYGAAEALALHEPALLVLAGRSALKLDETEEDLKSLAPKLKVKKLILDLNSFDSVRKAAAEVTYPVDVLINNAGIGPANEYTETKDGFEQAFQVNYLSGFLFTSLVFPRILEGRDRRIVNISSNAHQFSDIRYDDLDFDKGKSYDVMQCYGQSKTADILFSVALADKFGSKGITSFSVHPGGIPTNGANSFIERNSDLFKKSGIVDDDGKFKEGVFKPMDQGAATHVYAAFAPDIADQSGSYCVDSRVANDNAAPYALDKGNAERLWILTEEMLHERFYEG